MKLYIGEENIDGMIAKLTLRLPEDGVATFRFFGDGYVDESFYGEDFCEPYYSPSFIRTLAFKLKQLALEELKDEEVEAFNNTVYTHEEELAQEGECPCKECREKKPKVVLRVVK